MPKTLLTTFCDIPLMSIDASLWVATLLFAAGMLILAARRKPEACESEGESDMSFSADPNSFDAHSSRGRGFDLGAGWTLGGEGGDSDRT